MSTLQLLTVALAVLAKAAKAAPTPVEGIESFVSTIEHHAPPPSMSDAAPHVPERTDWPQPQRVYSFEKLFSQPQPAAPSTAPHRIISADGGVSETGGAQIPLAKPPAKRGAQRQSRGKMVTVEEAERLREQAIPEHLRHKYQQLPPVQGPQGKSFSRSHAKFWTNVAALRGPNFDERQRKHAASYILLEVQRQLKLKGPTTTGKVYAPHHLTETIPQLAARQACYVHKPGYTRPSRPVGASVEQLPDPTPKMAPQQLNHRVRELVKAAVARTERKEDVTVQHRILAGRYTRTRFHKLEYERIKAERSGRPPPRAWSIDSRTHEAEDVIQLAEREGSKVKYIGTKWETWPSPSSGGESTSGAGGKVKPTGE